MVSETETFRWAGLTLNTSKCAALNNRERKFMDNFTPLLEEGRVIPALQWTRKSTS
jgi:hypothetical protein